MSLSHIATLFPEVVHTPVETIAYEPNWIYAQKCETWWRGSEDLDPVTVLLVYRSPLVKETGKMYRPVSELILPANKFEIIAEGSQANPSWWGERAEFMAARMTQASRFADGPLDMASARKIIEAVSAETLSLTLETV
ncbi:hypothetical protein SEA_NICOLETERA_72 [Mycobacterium phage NicoleTera]|nr:hypothetical protein SEA_NICOLETERA_72 [Mycobacterium phage NicoleTera]